MSAEEGTPEFVIENVYSCFAEVCSSLTVDEIAKRLGAEFPDPDLVWILSPKKLLHDGKKNGSQCDDNPDAFRRVFEQALPRNFTQI